jgi:tetratricopeptide (TPR) repeat protein
LPGARGGAYSRDARPEVALAEDGMPDTVRCPGCGTENPAGASSCAACNLPLTEDAGSHTPVAPAPAPQGGEPPVIVRRVRPIRPRRPRPAGSQSVALWLLFGTFCAAVVLYYAITGFQKNNAGAPVEGSSEDQQKAADALRAALAKDSTNIQARIDLANLLYDTGNWSEAIVNYRSAIARDSTRTTALVDLGVCYFNLGATAEAERLFQLALAREPNQPVALFNLGIVSQQRSDHKTALSYFHRAMMNHPPEEMKAALMDGMKRSYDALGVKAPPLTK